MKSRSGRRHPDRPTIEFIAKEAGYSRATVSRAIGRYGYVSEKARRAIDDVIQKYHYRPSGIARSMVRGKTNTIGLVVTDIGNPFYSVIARSVEEVASTDGYSVLICNSDESLEKEVRGLNLLLQAQVDGLIVAAAVDEKGEFNKELYRELFSHLPIVGIDRPLPDECSHLNVLASNYEGGYDATKHLIQLGHTRIALITTKQALPNVRERERGYLEAIRNAGYASSPALRVELDSRAAKPDFGPLRRLFRKKARPTAAFATTNLLTIATLRELSELGLAVPEDVAFVGFDDLPDADLYKSPVTVVSQPARDIGATAMRMLLQVMDQARNRNGRSQPRRISLPVQLIVRDSCGLRSRAQVRKETTNGKGTIRR